MLRDYLAALAQTRLPLRARIVLLLAAGEADLRHTEAGEKDLRMLLGLSHDRHLQEALEQLVAMRMIDRVEGSGRRAHAYRLRPIEDWLEPRWTDDRKAAMWRVAYLRSGRLAQEASFSAPEMGALGPFARPHRGAHRKGVARPFGGAHKRVPSTPLPAGAQTAAPTTTPPCELTSPDVTRAGREGGDQLAPEAERLIEAFRVGTGAEKVTGSVRAGLVQLAAQANGTLEALVEAAQGPEGPTLYRKRVAWLRELLTTTSIEGADPTDKAWADRERRRLAGERARLEAELGLLAEDEALGKPGAAEEAGLLRQRLATMEA